MGHRGRAAASTCAGFGGGSRAGRRAKGRRSPGRESRCAHHSALQGMLSSP